MNKEKKKRKYPCWNCDSGQGHYDNDMSEGAPFNFLRCDNCGVWWAVSPHFGVHMRIRNSMMSKLEHTSSKIVKTVKGIISE